MELKVFLLSSTEEPELSTFFSHLGHEFDFSKTIDVLSSKVLKQKIDLLLIEENFFLDSINKVLLQRVFSRLKDAKICILNRGLKSFNWPHSGVYSLSDHQAFKSLLEDLINSKELIHSGYQVEEEYGEEPSFHGDEPSINNEIYAKSLETQKTKSLIAIKRCSSVDQVSTVLCESLEKVLKSRRKGIFLKYLPTYCSLVATSSFFFDSPRTLNGLGLNFSKAIKFNPEEHLQQGLKIPALAKLCYKTFGHRMLNSRVLTADKDIQGILVYEKPPADSLDIDLETLVDFAVTKLEAIKYKSLFRKNKIRDEKTNFVLKNIFYENLNNEILRAKRLFLPVTVFLIEIDNFVAIKSNYNQERVQLLIKGISKLLHSIVRQNDTVGSISENSFGIIFPHMHTVDADFKAEFMLLKIKQTQFFSDLKEKLQCTCSISIGTYPNNSSSGEDLMMRLQKSLDQREGIGETVKLRTLDPAQKEFNELSLSELSEYANGPLRAIKK